MSEPNKPSSAPQRAPQQWPIAQILREIPFVEQIFVPEQGDHSVEWPSGRQRISPEQLSRLISKTAYSIARRRNFHAGYEIEDWLGAEAEVMARMREIERAARVGPPAG